ncbi:MAG: hypothetical protein JST73_02075 [Actinobacteria bacterium]|nr:hypothetical protein [Actinomycetota bacterium]
MSHVAHDVNNDIVKPVERTNVETDLEVVGAVAGVAALTIGTGGLGDVALAGVSVELASSVTAAGIGVGVAATDCSRDPGTAKCVLGAIGAVAGVGGGALDLLGETVAALGPEWAEIGEYMSRGGAGVLGIDALGYGIASALTGDDAEPAQPCSER